MVQRYIGIQVVLANLYLILFLAQLAENSRKGGSYCNLFPYMTLLLMSPDLFCRPSFMKILFLNSSELDHSVIEL